MAIDLECLLGAHLSVVSEMDWILPLLPGSWTDLIDNRFHFQIPIHGLGFVADFQGRVSTIFLYAGNIDGYDRFSGSLPENLQFQDSRQTIRNKLGSPSASGGGSDIPFFGQVPNWDRFDGEQCSLHIQYDEDESSVNLISIMRPDSVPAS